MSSVISPSLSTIEQNAYKMGEKSTEILFQEIEYKHKNINIEYQKVVIDTQLVIRKST